ncbi:twitching motility protein PilT [Thalassobaculum fulvum]|uniref:Twitching motility protein PilT n=1 Tax=Thalassobaculum fulvum TaxID=1633335 RepID=A0A918XT27_9PROT|nr:type II toxin-antitoxin system VapC family toxin [Thalassobaculum fulvum]GHD53724.1 twitching motility protein PilT [Thalassobaculum fulvum]
MDLLLDTHVVLWWNEGDARLRPDVRDMVRDPDNTIYVSAATPWEIAIKARKGRMAFRGPLERLIEGSGFVPLPIDPAHGVMAGSLDWDHADPFDRVLVAQAAMENLVLVHADRAICDYGRVGQIWAA